MHRIVDGITTLNSKYDILLIGQLGVGKTSLIYKFIGDSSNYDSQHQVEELHFTQVNSKRFNVPCTEHSKYQQISILDSASLTELYSSRKAEQIKNASAILFAYLVSDRESFEALEYNIEAIQMITGENFPPFVVAGTKLDMYHGYQVLHQEGEELAARYGAAGFYEVSSQENRHVDEAFTPLVQSVLRKRLTSDEDLLSMAEILSEEEHKSDTESRKTGQVSRKEKSTKKESTGQAGYKSKDSRVSQDSNEQQRKSLTASLGLKSDAEEAVLLSTLVTSLVSQKRTTKRPTAQRERKGCCIIM